MKDNPLVIVLKLVIADPELRHLFIRSPGKVLNYLAWGVHLIWSVKEAVFVLLCQSYQKEKLPTTLNTNIGPSGLLEALIN